MGEASPETGTQYVLLNGVTRANPERAGAAEWTGPQLAKQCTKLSGKPCSRGVVAMTMRDKLQPKGLVTARKEGHKLLLWVATPEARTLTP